MMKPANDFVLCAGLAIALPAFGYGQTENPAVKSVQEVTAPAISSTVSANIVPLIWKASIGKSIVALPLRSIEYFGVQDYDVEGATRVRELTISTHSQSMIRIYHIRPLAVVTKTAGESLQALRNAAEGIVGEELDLPVKVFPSTTHSHMVEYRTGKEGDIDALFKHLEEVMIEYHARDLVPAQRSSTVREVRVAD